MSAPSPASNAPQPVAFTVPPMDAVDDLHGDPLTADLVVFCNGNQFMALDDLFAAFQEQYPAAHSIFYETLPPGILVEQVKAGALRMGALTVSAAPDVLTAGPDQLATLRQAGWVGAPVEYASNDLALLVRADNPETIRSLTDLGRDGIRIAMPNPATEGVGRLIVQALEAAGGQALARRVMQEKVETGQTRLTQIHHRESIRWLVAGDVEVAPLWSTEARYHIVAGAPIEQVAIAPEQNQRGRYAAALVERRARHRPAAEAFLRFLVSDSAAAIYRRYGFAPQQAQA